MQGRTRAGRNPSDARAQLAATAAVCVRIVLVRWLVILIVLVIVIARPIAFARASVSG
jgi:hypothetical protein